MKLLSGMIREPVLSNRNVKAELPIVLAEKRENGGPGERTADKTRETLFAGQLLANRSPIGTDATLNAATGRSVAGFYNRWYRPENTVISVVGDMDPQLLAAQIEKWFADWRGKGALVAAPSFGDPSAPAGADPANPVGETAVLVEPDLPRSLTIATLRPWRQVNDTIVYNQGILRDAPGASAHQSAAGSAGARRRQLSLCSGSAGQSQPFDRRHLRFLRPAHRRLARGLDGRARGDRRCAGPPAQRGRDRSRDCRAAAGVRKLGGRTQRARGLAPGRRYRQCRRYPRGCGRTRDVLTVFTV
jgi:hypothetical protein